jgi:hypothetical protein
VLHLIGLSTQCTNLLYYILLVVTNRNVGYFERRQSVKRPSSGNLHSALSTGCDTYCFRNALKKYACPTFNLKFLNYLTSRIKHTCYVNFLPTFKFLDEPHLVSRLRMNGAVPPLPYMTS